MTKKPTYEELKDRVEELEKTTLGYGRRQEVQIYRQTEPLPSDISIDDLSGTFHGPKVIDVAA